MEQRQVLYTGLDHSNYLTEGKVTHLPLIRIVPNLPSHIEIKKALEVFFQYTHVIITSKSSIKILADYLPLFGYEMDDWRKKSSVAVGTVTAAHLQAVGISPTIISKEETAEGIIKELDLLDLMDLNRCSFFWPHSAQARSVLPDFFHRRNASFVHCSLYDTETVLLKVIPNLDQFDEIVFTSPSTIKAFLHHFGVIPKDKKLICIGPVTKEFLDRVKFNFLA